MVEGVLSLALDTAVTFADIAGNAGDSFTTGVTDVTGEMVIDTVHLTVTSIERVPESDTGLPGGDTNADVLVCGHEVSGDRWCNDRRRRF